MATTMHTSRSHLRPTNSRGFLCPHRTAYGRVDPVRSGSVVARAAAAGSSHRQVLDTCLSHFKRRDLQGLLPYLPSQEIARGSIRISLKSGSPIMFEQVIEGMLLQNPEDHFLDSYALRNLVVSPPASCKELSSVMVGSDRWVCRQAVQALTGEEAVLTFTMTKNASLMQQPPSDLGPAIMQQPPPDLGPATSFEPPRARSQYDSSVSSALPPRQSKPWEIPAPLGMEPPTTDAAPKAAGSESPGSRWAQAMAPLMQTRNPDMQMYVDSAPMGVSGGAREVGTAQAQATRGPLPPAWRLTRVRGEPQRPILPNTPSPEFAPEQVVQAQLEALQNYEFAQSYAFLSPTAQGLVGPLDRFIGSMSKSKLYRPLVAHRSATSLRRCQHSADTYLEVVAVEGLQEPEPGRNPKHGVSLYCWIVTRQEEAGPLKDCWMTEWVKVVDDPKLLHVLGLPPNKREQDGR